MNLGELLDDVSNGTSAKDDIIELKRFHRTYLGGSRRMNQRCHETQPYVEGQEIIYIDVNERTDWDYYATYQTDVERWLITSCGWQPTLTTQMKGQGHNYQDSECVCILEKDNHQIVLRKNAEFYRDVFESIPIWFYYKYLWKSSPAGGIFGIDCSEIQPIFETLFMLKHKWSK